MTRKIEAGTVIAGTLRNEDLINAFLSEIDYLMAGYLDAQVADTYCEAMDIAYSEKFDSDEASEIVNELIDALNEYAPEDMYFGTQDGYVDSDFGWWYAQ